MADTHVENGSAVPPAQTFQCSICQCQHQDFAALQFHTNESNTQDARYHCPACGASACFMLQLSDGAGYGHLYTCRRFLEANGSPDNIDYDDLAQYCRDPVHCNGIEQAEIRTIPPLNPTEWSRPSVPAPETEARAAISDEGPSSKSSKGKRKASTIDYTTYTCSACQITSSDQNNIEQHVEAFNKQRVTYACPGCDWFACTCLQLIQDHFPYCIGFREWKQNQQMSDKHLTANCRSVFGRQVQATAEVQIHGPDEHRPSKARREEPAHLDPALNSFLPVDSSRSQHPDPHQERRSVRATAHDGAKSSVPSLNTQFGNPANSNPAAGYGILNNPPHAAFRAPARSNGVSGPDSLPRPSFRPAQSYFNPVISQILKPKYQPSPLQRKLHAPSHQEARSHSSLEQRHVQGPGAERSINPGPEFPADSFADSRHVASEPETRVEDDHGKQFDVSGYTTVSERQSKRQTETSSMHHSIHAAHSAKGYADRAQDIIPPVQNDQCLDIPEQIMEQEDTQQSQMFSGALGDDNVSEQSAVSQNVIRNDETQSAKVGSKRKASSVFPESEMIGNGNEATVGNHEPKFPPPASRESTEEARSPPTSAIAAWKNAESGSEPDLDQTLQNLDIFDELFPRITAPNPGPLLFPTCGEYLEAAKVANPKGITDLNDPDSWLEPLNDEDSVDWRSTLRWCKSCSWGVRIDDAGSHRPGCIIARKFRYDQEGNLILDKRDGVEE